MAGEPPATKAGGKRIRQESNTQSPGKAQPDKKKKAEITAVLTEAVKVKQLYTKAVVRGESLAGQIDTAEAWAWARTDQSVGQVRKMLADIKSQIDPGISRVLMEDMKDLKADMGEQTLLEVAKSFNKLKPDLETLDLKLNSLFKAHKTMQG